MNCTTVIICTADRPDDLRATLRSIVAAHKGHRDLGEILVVDNSATGTAATVTAAAECPAFRVRYLHEPRRGKGYAYNAGMEAAVGDVLVFTDDDVRVPRYWALRMAEPIRTGRADA
ncbi:MAG TPA: glycosyltransferase family A protein, partial [Humisphaera sp.]